MKYLVLPFLLGVTSCCSALQELPFDIFPTCSVITIGGAAKVGPNGGGFSKGDGPALAAHFRRPGDIKVFDNRYVYFCDRGNNCIRRIDVLSSTVTIVAGTGEKGFSGDGGPASCAKLCEPVAIAIDEYGNLLVAGGNRVRRVDGKGVISTIMGTGKRAPARIGSIAAESPVSLVEGLAVDSRGHVYLALYDYDLVIRINATSGLIEAVAGGGDSLGDGGPATEASLSEPHGLCFDQHDNLYIADSGQNRIRVVRSQTGIIETVVGDGSETGGDGCLAIQAGTTHPWDLAYANGFLYFADGDHYIRKVDLERGIVTRAVGSGVEGHSDEPQQALSCLLYGATNLAADGKGNIFISDGWNHRIKVAIRPAS